MIKKIGQKIMANKDANETMFGYLKRGLTPGDEVTKTISQSFTPSDYSNALSTFSKSKPDNVPQKVWDTAKSTMENAKFDTNTGMYAASRDTTSLDRALQYFNNETHGTLRKTVAGAGIGAAALGGMAIDRSDGQGGFGGTILGAGAGVGGIALGLSQVAKKL